jgi:magnesium transporter
VLKYKEGFRRHPMAFVDKNTDKKQSSQKTITFGDMTWIDIVQPTKESIRYLAEHYKFNPLDLEDALSPRQVPKIEEYPGYLFAVFHFSLYDKETRVSNRRQWSAFVGENLLVTLRPAELKAPDELFRECEAKEDAREAYMNNGPGYLLYQIIDRAVDSYFKVLDKILSLMEDIEDNVFKENIEIAMEISVLRRDIITQRRVMFPTRQLLTELEKRLKRFAKTDLTLFFSDLHDHMNKICDTLDEYNETIEVFKDADYTLSGYRSNRTIRMLAVLFAIGLPFLVIAGLYVMLPGGFDKGSLPLFLALLIIIFVIIGIMLYSFRRRHII